MRSREQRNKKREEESKRKENKNETKTWPDAAEANVGDI